MATIHIRQLEAMLKERGELDAQYVIEIRFDSPGRESSTVDEEFKNKRFNVSSANGPVNIYFNDKGDLASIEWS